MDIINACETGEPFRFNGNVPNASAGERSIKRPPGQTAAWRCRASPVSAGSSPVLWARSRATWPR